MEQLSKLNINRGQIANEVGSAGKAVLSLKTCSGSFCLSFLFRKRHSSAEPFISLGWMRCSIAPSLFSSKYLALSRVCMGLDERGHDAEKTIGPLRLVSGESWGPAQNG
jgi:hypothetical protein